ncbi:MAG: hypothetical protein FJY11_08540 [Bacteroidetes bacterium]|nr:hypothetical protein [Bacteroidota bacterium]
MSLLSLYRAGFRKSVRSFRPIVLLWIISLAGSLLVVAPLERNIGSILDGTLASELLYDGFDIDVFADIMHAIMPALAAFSITFLLVTAILFLANTFITAGLYRILAGNWKKPYRRRIFLRGADRGFGGFLFVALATGALIVITVLLIVIVPAVILTAAGATFQVIRYTGLATGFLVILALPVFLLTADYARAMLTADKYLSPFRAMTGAARSIMKRKFFRLWIAMMLIILFSALAGFAGMKLVVYSKASAGAGLFVLLIVSQLFVFLKSWIRVFRYGTVTAIFESVKD